MYGFGGIVGREVKRLALAYPTTVMTLKSKNNEEEQEHLQLKVSMLLPSSRAKLEIALDIVSNFNGIATATSKEPLSELVCLPPNVAVNAIYGTVPVNEIKEKISEKLSNSFVLRQTCDEIWDSWGR